MEKEIKKPDKFKIKVENNNSKEIIDFLVKKGYANNAGLIGSATNGNYYSYNTNELHYITCRNLGNCKEYTLEEFKKLFESQFEVGKWYIYGKWYLKFKQIHNGLFQASEYIDPEKNYSDNLNNFNCGEANNSKILLENLSEIQQYLPDNHPDKINTTPEYVECIIDERKLYNNFGELNKIYKVIDWNYSTTDCLLEGTTSGSTAKRRFKPSTKEAYDNQNNKNMFKKDDYIVITDSYFEMSNFSINYIYKQRSNYDSLSVYKDNVDIQNGYGVCSFDNSGRIKWRYATKEEIVEYDRLNKPFDVTTLNTKKYDYEVVHCTTQEEWDFVANKLNRTSTVNYLVFGDCININRPNQSDTVNYFTKLNSKIYSFQEWCDKFNHKPDFNKKLTELPEKWCISRNLSTENNIIVTNWINKKYNTGYVSTKFEDSWYGINNKSYTHNSLNNLLNDGYTEITFEQFERWVLNKDNMNSQPKFKVGDKVCIPRTKRGDPWYKNNDKQLDNYNENYFIISNYLYNKYVELKRADNGIFETNLFYESDLVLYTENKTEEKWIPKVGDYIYANANIKGYGPQVTKIDEIYWESNEYFHCVCKFKHLDGTLHPCLNTNWNYQIDNINNFLRLATKEEIYNYEKEQLLKKGEPIINDNSHEWFIGNNINKIITSPIELQEVDVDFSEIEKAYEKVEKNQQLREHPLIPKESYNIKKLPTKSWY